MEIVDITSVRKAHKRLLSDTAFAIERQSAEAGMFAKNYVQAHPTFKPRTGNLQAKTDWQIARTRGGRIVKIRNTAKYAHAIESGARPHKITGRRGKKLRFVVGGRLMFRRSVNHPGNRPYRFLYRATTAAGRVLEQGLAHAMIKIASKF